MNQLFPCKHLLIWALPRLSFRISQYLNDVDKINYITVDIYKFQMSIVPMMFRDWWDDWERPSRLLDQHFGVGLRKDDLLSSLSSFPSSSILRNSYFRPWRANLARQESASTINLTKEKFEVGLLL